jgi:hypothetical protein
MAVTLRLAAQDRRPETTTACIASGRGGKRKRLVVLFLHSRPDGGLRGSLPRVTFRTNTCWQATGSTTNTMIEARDYSLTGPEADRAVALGLSQAEWYRSDVPRKEMKALMQRSDGPAIRDTAVLLRDPVRLRF